MASKAELDRRVALQLGWRVRDIKRVTTAFLEATSELLAEQGAVKLDRLGTLSVSVKKRVSAGGRLRRGTGQSHQPLDPRARQVLVRFKKCHALAVLLKPHARKADQHGQAGRK